MANMDDFFDIHMKKKEPMLKEKGIMHSLLLFFEKRTVLVSILFLSLIVIPAVEPLTISNYILTIIFVVLKYFGYATFIYLILDSFGNVPGFHVALYISFVSTLVGVLFLTIPLVGFLAYIPFIIFLYMMLLYYIPKLSIMKFFVILILDFMVHIIINFILFFVLNLFGFNVFA